MISASPAPAEQATKKILVVFEEPADVPHPVVDFWKEMLEGLGHEVTTCRTIVEGWGHLGDGRNKYDLVIMDPLNQQIILDGPMKEPSKIAALGILSRAKKGGAQTIVSMDRDVTTAHYDLAALQPFMDSYVEHGSYEAMMTTVESLLGSGRRR